MVRIKVKSRVSTEAWQFDGTVESPNKRWSYAQFGENWADSRIFGTVIGRAGSKWVVQWDIDSSQTTCETDYLLLEKPSNSDGTGIEFQNKTTAAGCSDSSNPDSAESDIVVSDDDEEFKVNDEITTSSSDEDALYMRKQVLENVERESKSRHIEYYAEGEEVYLCLREKRLFKAKYSQCPVGSKVHNEKVTVNHARFIIVKVLRAAAAWIKFDEDKHCENAFVLWTHKNVQKIPLSEGLDWGSDARSPTVLETKKQKRNPEKWQKNKRKKALDKGIIKPGQPLEKVDDFAERIRVPKTPCTDGCSKKCTKIIDEKERKKICNNFWDIEGWDMKTAYLTERVKPEPIKRRRIRAETKSGKRRTRSSIPSYSFITSNKRKVMVCQRFFLATLDLSQGRVKYCLKYKRSDTNTPVSDKRGRSDACTYNRVDLAREESILNHIKSFDTLESHYTRKNTKYEYLPDGLNLSKMYRLYLVWCAERNVKAEPKGLYCRVFHSRFNLKFNKSKKDACDYCTSFNNIPLELLTEHAKEEHNSHLFEKDKAREFKKEMKMKAKETECVVTAAFDMQKVLLLPHGETSSFYYSRRLRVTNLSITELDSMVTRCYIWDESQAKKGSCEVSSIVFKFLKEMHLAGKKVIHFFSDRCGGQNNNRMVLVMLSLAPNIFHFDEITMNYLVTGHSQNENDNAHSCIESHTRGKTIYTLDQWELAIQMSFIKNKVKVFRIHYDDIIDFKNAKALHPYSNVLTKGATENYDEMHQDCQSRVYWSKIMQVKFVKERPSEMLFKYNYYDQEYKSATLACFPTLTRRSNDSTFYSERNLPKLYFKSLEIAPEKKQDLMKLCSRNLIPDHHHQYYESFK